jgi:hypothetical protein
MTASSSAFPVPALNWIVHFHMSDEQVLTVKHNFARRTDVLTCLLVIVGVPGQRVLGKINFVT